MRIIKFRGKSLDNDEWVCGFLAYGNLICTWDNIRNCHEVLSTTVGQFTGLHDKHGHEIYEGDIVRHDENGKCYSIIYEEPMFRFAPNDDCFAFLNHPELLEVVGNIHDLIEKGGKQ